MGLIDAAFIQLRKELYFYKKKIIFELALFCKKFQMKKEHFELRGLRENIIGGIWVICRFEGKEGVVLFSWDYSF